MNENKKIVPDDARLGSLPLEMIMKHTGLQLLQMMARGELPGPPIAKIMNFVLDDAELGKAVFCGSPTLEHYNPAGTVHGGLAGNDFGFRFRVCGSIKITRRHYFHYHRI